MNIWLLGILIFLARVVDVSVGTLRTISIVQGRTKIAFFLAFIETSVWLLVLSAVLPQVMHTPILGLFYAFGFATGNVVGILVEKRLAMGYTNFRVITTKFAESASQIQKASRGYKDINLLAMKLLNPGGILFTFSCSGHITQELFQKIVSDAALDSGREVKIIKQMTQSADHTVALNFPEGLYLKGLILKAI